MIHSYFHFIFIFQFFFSIKSPITFFFLFFHIFLYSFHSIYNLRGVRTKLNSRKKTYVQRIKWINLLLQLLPQALVVASVTAKSESKLTSIVCNKQIYTFTHCPYIQKRQQLINFKCLKFSSYLSSQTNLNYTFIYKLMSHLSNSHRVIPFQN